MADLTGMLMAASGSGGGQPDPNFNQTVLLLHGDGTNGAQNNTFLDSSTNNFTVTRNGNTTQGTFSPFSVGAKEWGNFFNGTTDYLTFPTVANNNFDFAAGTDFTVEAWIYPISGRTSIFITSGNQSGTGGFFVNTSPTDYYLRFFSFVSDATIAEGTTSVPFNQWSHVAVTRAGTTLRIFLNGALEATATNNESFNPTSGDGAIGSQVTEQFFSHGYTSNVRVVKGTALYTSAFTPPTTPLTAVSGTELLTCQDNRFKDNSTNNFAITVNGNPSVQPFSPFAPSAAYDPSVNGGSGYFDGSGDYLSVADDVDFDMSSGDFCVEAWIYPVSGTGSNGGILGSSLASSPPIGWTFRYLSGTSKLSFGNGSNNYDSTATIPLNAWTHVAATRSGTDLRLFINGALDSTNAGISATVDLSSTAFYVGRGYDVDGGNAYFKGYIFSARVVKGAAVYTSAFTPPTAPLTAISGTSFLANFTNAGIFDNTGKNNLETVGNAQIDTTTKKYGTGSMEFDGTGDYLLMPKSENFAFGTGDFTVEFWWNPSTLATAQILIYNTDDGGASGTGEYVIVYNTTLGLRFYLNAGAVDINQGATTGWSTGQFYHVAVVRNGNTLSLYRNGTSIASGSVSGSTIGSASVPFYIAGDVFSSLYATGFIDDLRITKGVARYTANFTPPTAALPDL